jgi:hypothetical protein
MYHIDSRGCRMLAALAVPQTIKPESPQQPCATEAQLGPTSQHEEPCSDLVQRREELSALVQRPQLPRVAVETQVGPERPQQIGPKSPRKREEQSALRARRARSRHQPGDTVGSAHPKGERVRARPESPIQYAHIARKSADGTESTPIASPKGPMRRPEPAGAHPRTRRSACSCW